MPLNVAPARATHAPAELAAVVRSGAVTRGTFSPRVLEALLALPGLPEQLASLRLLRCSGEGPPASLAARLHAAVPRCRLVNVYGMTETTGDVTFAELKPGDGPSFLAGRPLPGIRFRLEPSVAGELDEGEVWIQGPTLACGYLHPETASPKFVDVRETGADAPTRWYRSGDRGRRTPDGRLEILGRVDLQLNVSGLRVDPVEVETVLRRHPAVQDAAVWTHDDAEGRSRLVAYVVDAALPAPTASLRRFLAAELPRTAVPSRIVRLQALPRTPSGKLNRPALPRPEVVDASATEPRNALERQILAIFKDVLGAPGAGIRDDYFDLGGDSLGAAAVLARISKIVGKTLPAAMILDAPTVEEMARAVGSFEERQVTAIHLSDGDGSAPLWCLPGFVGDPLWFGPLLPFLGSGMPVLGLSLLGLKPPVSIGDAAARCTAAMLAVQPSGPYSLLGYSVGGILAVEMAAALRRRGESVEFLGLIDARAPKPGGPLKGVPPKALLSLAYLRFRVHLAAGDFLRSRLRKPLLRLGIPIDRLVPSFVEGLAPALRRHWVTPSDVELTLFRAVTPSRPGDPYLGWGPYARAGVKVVEIQGDHYTLLRAGRAQVLGARIREALAESRARATGSSRDV